MLLTFLPLTGLLLMLLTGLLLLLSLLTGLRDGARLGGVPLTL